MTLEPCCHFGKTPPCTDAILAAGIARVVVAMRDPFPEVNGGGLATLEAAGLTVEIGCEADAARSLNAPYLKRLTTGMPFVTAKWAMTLDGKTAVASGDSRWISSESLAQLGPRAAGANGCDRGRDRHRRSRRSAPHRPPSRPALSGAGRARQLGRLPLSSRLVQTARRGPGHRRGHRASDASRVASSSSSSAVKSSRSRDSVASRSSPLLEELGRRGMTNVLVEGGGQVLGSFLDEGQVDAVDVFIAPILEGGDHARTAVRGKGSEPDERRAPAAASRGLPGRRRHTRPWLLAPALAHPGGLRRRLSDLDHADGRSLQSQVVMAWILLIVSCRVLLDLSTRSPPRRLRR